MTLLEASYLAKVGPVHRKAFGQFFTHPEVAKFMVNWVLASGNPDIHDPAFGLGAFYKAIPAGREVGFSGSEIDPELLAYWLRAEAGRPVEVIQEDYLLAWGRRHGNIVCNPPYMRFQKFLNRGLVFAEFEKHLNLRLPGYINTASAFLVKSLAELESSGRLAYVMPLEFLNTGYGSLVKERLLAGSHLAALIRLDCEREAFPDATTSAGIVLYDAARQYSQVNFYVAESLQSLEALLDQEPVARVSYDCLRPKDKWLSYFDTDSITIDQSNTVPLHYYGRFSRGIATGANRFFVLKPSQARNLGLSDSEVAPVITKSSQIGRPLFTEQDYAALTKRDAPTLLFSVTGAGSAAAEHYIRLGESEGYHRRFITGNRTPWYKNEIRQPAPILLGVFSRGGYKIIRNTSNALNLTCFHGFQPNMLGRQYLDHIFLYLSSKLGRQVVSRSMRRYGDSLDKFEPNDLNGALVPANTVFDMIPEGKLADALSQLQETGNVPDYVESWFSHLKQ